MIGTSKAEYVFIRICIFGLGLITPLSVLYTVLARGLGCRIPWLPIFVEIWLTIETLFFFLVSLPRQYYIQRAAVPPASTTREERQALFTRVNENIDDLERFLTRWFLDSPLAEIKRENFKEWLRWAFLNTADTDSKYDDELEGYTQQTEAVLGRKLAPGRGKAKSLRTTLDKVNMTHRSLLWYGCILFLDTSTSLRLWAMGFEYYRTPLSQFFNVFPFRLHNLLSRKTSPSKTITYWHRPHTSKTRLPILFIHGIGVGLYPYIPFLRELNQSSDPDGQIGIIAIEILPISSRITTPVLRPEEMTSTISTILARHGWDRVVLASHSYGSVVSAHLLRDPVMSPRIGPALLVDPVCFLLHLPDVAYNFVYRKPQRANEYQLQYFGALDGSTAHTLGRCFFWSENILWKEDLGDRRVTVGLGGEDSIIDAKRVGKYLATGSEAGKEDCWRCREWEGKGLEVLWFGHLDHAQVFDKKSNRKRLVDVARGYCETG